ncbi:ATP-binding protein [bacterium]|nr:ATP-binding protein [bacterium]
MSEIENESIDIRSTLGQELDYYEKRTYKPDYAIAEFVDNSIQSYLTVKPLLKLIDSEYKLKIEINYDINNDSLEIKDNAGGMTKEVFRNALILGNKPTNLNGLNEFGYGLKTAAS